jgi:hypothetical protein
MGLAIMEDRNGAHVGLDVSLKLTAICVESNESV